MKSVLVLVGLYLAAQAPSLESPSPEERREAVRSLAVLGNRDAVPGLVEAYRNEPLGDIRREIVAGLGRIRDRSAAAGLIDAMRTDFVRDIRLQAIDSLLRLYIPIADDEGFFSFFGGVARVFSDEERPRVSPNVTVDADVPAALVRVLQEDFDAEVRLEAVHALGSLAATDQLTAMVAELESPRHREYGEVRLALIETLAEFEDPAAGPALTLLIRDSRVGDAAIDAIGRVGYREAYPQLSNLFRSSPDGGVRERALQSIALLRHPDATAFLEPLLDSREAKERELAAEGLARLDYDPSSFAIRIDREDDDGVRLAQAFALVRSGQSAFVDLLVEVLDTRRWPQAEAYLYELGRFEDRIELIHLHLRNPDADVRERLLRVLGRIGNPESRPHVEPLTMDRNADVAAAAVAALRQLVSR